MFNAKAQDFGFHVGAGDLPRAATALGVLIGLTAATLPADEAHSFFAATFNVDPNSLDDMTAAAAYVTRTFQA